MDVLGQSLAVRRRPRQYWPRRLLHIPTMHSYEKRAGNIYGLQDPVIEPPYATLSYTWARYIRHKSTSAPGIRISGIDWETPDIEPLHFTAPRLLQAIRKVRNVSHLDYMWIDIACINIEQIMNDDLDPESAMQLDIFLDAAAPFIWLSRTRHSCILHLAKALSDASLLDDAKTATTLLQVLNDPWFSSLWTLLEAAMRTDSVILSSNCRVTNLNCETFDPALIDEPNTIRIIGETGESVTIKLKGWQQNLQGGYNAQSPSTSQFFCLRHLILILKKVMGSMPLGEARDRVQEAANKSGILSLDCFNILSLYGSAQTRQEMKPGLRMRYVHKQIFGFDGLQMDDTLPQVEIHFNSQLIRRYPVLSQLFIRRTPLQTGSAWRLTTGSKIPDMQFFVAYASSYRCLFKLKVETSADIGPTDDSYTVIFRGPTSEFKRMAFQWQRNGLYPSDRLLGISFDQCTVSRRDGSAVEIATNAMFPTLSPGGYELSQTSQRDLIGRFSGILGDLEARVLAMATGCGILPGYRVGIGLIIVAQHCGSSKKAWQRVGLCFWAFEENEVTKEENVDTEGSDLPKGRWEVTEGHSVC